MWTCLLFLYAYQREINKCSSLAICVQNCNCYVARYFSSILKTKHHFAATTKTFLPPVTCCCRSFRQLGSRHRQRFKSRARFHSKEDFIFVTYPMCSKQNQPRGPNHGPSDLHWRTFNWFLTKLFSWKFAEAVSRGKQRPSVVWSIKKSIASMSVKQIRS